ncbi:unnamed protein product [Sphenostylis stenocarpa]|uniref:Uncharacterized protein n=1 Tax=Sphenostylis stenocarpa TaxID=92480 RepID=A0AA86W6C4_9FABA|nr:unnamed protein product [Sphenostylis stenocarpa]
MNLHGRNVSFPTIQINGSIEQGKNNSEPKINDLYFKNRSITASATTSHELVHPLFTPLLLYAFTRKEFTCTSKLSKPSTDKTHSKWEKVDDMKIE